MVNYSKINKALAKEFGTGQVELRKDNNPEWEFLLWFKEDEPSETTIAKAQEIVAKYQPAQWYPEKAMYSET